MSDAGLSFDTASKVTGLGVSDCAVVCAILALTSARFAARSVARSRLDGGTGDEAMVRNKTRGVYLRRYTAGLNMHGAQSVVLLEAKPFDSRSFNGFSLTTPRALPLTTVFPNELSVPR